MKIAYAACAVNLIIMIGFFVFAHTASAASTCPSYREPVPPQIEGWTWTYAPAHPIGIRYARCVLRGLQR